MLYNGNANANPNPNNNGSHGPLSTEEMFHRLIASNKALVTSNQALTNCIVVLERRSEYTGWTDENWADCFNAACWNPKFPPRSWDGTPSNLVGVTDTRWRIDNVGFFDPLAPGQEEIVFVGRDIYYRLVQLFVKRVKDIALIKGAATIHLNLSLCLRGIAIA